MTDQERNQVLKMIADGRITPEEGLQLMQVLDQDNPVEELTPVSSGSSARDNEIPHEEPQTTQADLATDPRIERVKSTVRRLWQIPLWIGIAITVLSALGMYAIMRSAGMNFWFFFLLLPLLLGVMVIALAVGSRRARWLFVNVHQQPGEHPAHIFLGFPLPLKFAAWFLRVFGSMIPHLRKTNLDEMIQIIETGFTGENPLIVNVDEGEEGERVQVYIG